MPARGSEPLLSALPFILLTQIRVFDIVEGVPLAIYRGHTDIVRSIAYLEEKGLYVTGSWDGTIRMWHEVQHQSIFKKKKRKNAIEAGDGSFVVSWGCQRRPDGGGQAESLSLSLRAEDGGKGLAAFGRVLCPPWRGKEGLQGPGSPPANATT